MLSVLGLPVGVLIGYLASEELKPGKHYLNILVYLLIASAAILGVSYWLLLAIIFLRIARFPYHIPLYAIGITDITSTVILCVILIVEGSLMVEPYTNKRKVKFTNKFWVTISSLAVIYLFIAFIAPMLL